MANPEQLEILKRGSEAWNRWREQNAEAEIDLKESQLRNIDLSGAHLKDVHFENAILWEANLKGADLRSAYLEGADLWGAHLEGAVLREAHLGGTVLWEAHLEGAVFRGADLEEADLRNAFLEGADFWEARLQRANLSEANLQKTNLTKAMLEDALLMDANFNDNNSIGNTDWGKQCGEEVKGYYSDAENIYRALQKIFEAQGVGSLVGEFAYKKNRARQKLIWKERKNPLKWFWFAVLDMLCGYGEKPERAILWLFIVIAVPGFVYYLAGGLPDTASLFDCLYFSIVSATTMGYGNWVIEPLAWARMLGGVQSLLGAFLMALFVTTFTRWIMR
jgi:hypothetical protein